ncbi:MAG: VWA domain-containing protein [Flavobacteriia bacterium]|nr:VWA domain-containing protein [Flavobacteriia bacterium]
MKKLIVSVVMWEIISSVMFTLLFSLLGYESDSKEDHLVFKYPSLLVLEGVVLPIIALFIFSIYKTNKLTNSVAPIIRKTLFNENSFVKLIAKYVLFRLILTTLIIAIAQPFYGAKKIKGTKESLELVVALDISNSMNTKDIDKKMSRLEISKRALIQLINNLHGEKLGISIFAGSAYVQLPMTSDYSAAKLFVNEIETGMISNQGTNVSEAIRISMKMFSKAKIGKGIILVTDGENHEADPEIVYEALLDQDIQLCVLGIGSNQGGLVPNNPFRPELGYKQDAQGNPIVSKIDKTFIKYLANKASGFAVITSNAYPNLTAIMQKINSMKRKKVDEIEFNVEQSRYQIPLFISLCFWLIYLIGFRNHKRPILN